MRNKNITPYNKNALKVISATGAIIFYGVFLFNSIMFNDPIFYAIHNYALTLVGLTLSAFSLLASFESAFMNNFKIKKGIMLPTVGILVVLYGSYFTVKQTPLNIDLSAARPYEVKIFSYDIDKILQGRSLAVLWYEMYNSVIINYYRIKNNLPIISFYTNEFYKDLWFAPYSPKNNENIRKGIQKTFEEADFVIIPEFSDSYFKYEPYPLYHCSDDLADYLNSPKSPRFVIRKILHEPGNVRLLLLQKEKDALSDGRASRVSFEPLKLPYGSSSSSSKPKYFFVPSDKLTNLTKNFMIEVSSKTGTHHYERAFDRSIAPDSFWEVVGKYPFWMMFEYENKVKINKYLLQTGECPERMPTEWELQGSLDGKEWVGLDKRSGTDWQRNEKKEYKLMGPKEYKYYRLYFTAGGTVDILRVYEIELSISTEE